MANEFTLASYQMTAPDPLSRVVAKTWREASPIMDMLTFKTSTMLSQKVLRFNSLNATTWRKIGEDFVQYKVNPDSVEERLYFMGNKIDVPYEYTKAESLVDLRATQSDAIVRAMAFGFNDAFFNNTPTDDEDAIVGLWYRLINDLASAQSIDGGGLDISSDTALTTAVWTNRLFDLVDDAMMQVEGEPNQKVLFMGRVLYRRFQSACRQSNLLDTTTDQLGRQFLTYGKGGPKIVDVGYKVNQTSTILGDVETAAGTALTTGTFSSLFCVRFGEPYVSGWCQEMPFVDDVGLLEDRVNVRTVVRFSPGLYLTHPRSCSRVYDIQAA